MKYRKKPVEVEAFQLGFDQTPEWFKETSGADREVRFCTYKGVHCCEIETLEGVMTAYVGDYIIKGVQGELYPCKADIFEATYEVA